MVAGINKPFTPNPNLVTFSRIENNSELHYMREKNVSPTESYWLGLF